MSNLKKYVKELEVSKVLGYDEETYKVIRKVIAATGKYFEGNDFKEPSLEEVIKVAKTKSNNADDKISSTVAVFTGNGSANAIGNGKVEIIAYLNDELIKELEGEVKVKKNIFKLLTNDNNQDVKVLALSNNVKLIKDIIENDKEFTNFIKALNEGIKEKGDVDFEITLTQTKLIRNILEDIVENNGVSKYTMIEINRLLKDILSKFVEDIKSTNEIVTKLSENETVKSVLNDIISGDIDLNNLDISTMILKDKDLRDIIFMLSNIIKAKSSDVIDVEEYEIEDEKEEDTITVEVDGVSKRVRKAVTLPREIPKELDLETLMDLSVDEIEAMFSYNIGEANLKKISLDELSDLRIKIDEAINILMTSKLGKKQKIKTKIANKIRVLNKCGVHLSELIREKIKQVV